MKIATRHKPGKNVSEHVTFDHLIHGRKEHCCLMSRVSDTTFSCKDNRALQTCKQRLSTTTFPRCFCSLTQPRNPMLWDLSCVCGGGGTPKGAEQKHSACEVSPQPARNTALPPPPPCSLFGPLVGRYALSLPGTDVNSSDRAPIKLRPAW